MGQFSPSLAVAAGCLGSKFLQRVPCLCRSNPEGNPGFAPKISLNHPVNVGGVLWFCPSTCSRLVLRIYCTSFGLLGRKIVECLPYCKRPLHTELWELWDLLENIEHLIDGRGWCSSRYSQSFPFRSSLDLWFCLFVTSQALSARLSEKDASLASLQAANLAAASSGNYGSCIHLYVTWFK